MGDPAGAPDTVSMSRTRKASIVALFSYVRFALQLGALLLIPLIIARVGGRAYGFWLASGEAFAYAGLADLGVLGVLPWLVATADGRGDRAALRRLLVNGTTVGVVVGLFYGGLVLSLCLVLPSLLRFTDADRADVIGPLVVLAVGGTLATPLRIFQAALEGLQDVVFNGVTRSVQSLLTLVITLVLLLAGYRLHALAIAVAVPALLVGVASLIRFRVIAPDLVAGWGRPSLAFVRTLFREGIGPWLSGWGWQLSAASDGIIIAMIGQPTAVTMLAVTSKLGRWLMQFCWVPCDSGLVGLAHLFGEGRVDHVRATSVAMLRVYLGLAAAVACVVLAANRSFVGFWVGPELFAGRLTSGLVAASILALSLGHGVTVVAAVLGKRLEVGVFTLVAGVVHVGLAYVFGVQWGLPGIVAATIVSQAFIVVPGLVPHLHELTGLTPTAVATEILTPWLKGFAPVGAVALALGLLVWPPVWIGLPLGAALGGVYLWYTRWLYLEYPPMRRIWQRVTSLGPLARLAIFLGRRRET